MIKKNFLFVILYFLVFTITMSLVVANRDIHIVEDNIIYINNFLNKMSFNDIRYEFFFDLLTLIIRCFTDNYVVYFFVLNVILNLILLALGIQISRFYNINFEIYIPLLFIFLVFSSWYYSAATNGLRQGLSLSFCYIAMINLLLYKKMRLFLILITISILFHYSTALLLPFVILSKLRLNKLFSVSLFFSIGYFLGLNELIVEFFSNTFNIPLYSLIKGYMGGDSDSYRYGFQLDLFIYTLGFSFIYYIFNNFILKNENKLNLIVKIYLILALPYYMFGFGAFSNRYGVMSWFFTAFINSLIFYLLFKNKKNIFLFGFVFLWFSSVLYFIFNYMDFI